MFADDGLLMTQNLGDMKKLLKQINEISKELGMKINKDKSMILTINAPEVIDQVEGIHTQESFKYLGVTVCKDRDCFKLHKEGKIKDCRRLSNLTYSVITKSCNKVLIGKTYWKSVVLPSVLYGTAAVMWNVNELKELQTEENKVWRFIMGGSGYVAVAALRGDLGASCMKVRDIKTKIKYVKNVLNGELGKLTKDIMRDMFEKGYDSYGKLINK